MGMDNVASVLNTISNANNVGMAKGMVKAEYTAAANEGVKNLAVGLALGEATGGLLGQIGKGLKGAAVGTAESTGSNVYRVFGGDAKAGGFSWTTENPNSVANFRDAVGLPSGGASGARQFIRYCQPIIVLRPPKLCFGVPRT